MTVVYQCLAPSCDLLRCVHSYDQSPSYAIPPPCKPGKASKLVVDNMFECNQLLS